MSDVPDTVTGPDQATTIATTILVVQTGAALTASLCPSWLIARSQEFHAEGGTDNIRFVRRGYMAASAVTLVTGWIASVMVRSPLPLFGAVLITLVEIAGYEHCVRNPAMGPQSGHRAFPWGR